MDINEVTKMVQVKDFRFPIVDYGEGPAVLLLHGFPDSRHLWRYQIPILADAGLRVLAPDLRGFGDAPKPKAVNAYKLSHVLSDLIAILDVQNLKQVRVVGHDWGAAVAWRFAAYFPQKVERLVCLSVGCPGTSGGGTIEQRERSWYVYFFQFVGITEAWLRHDNWKLVHELTRGNGDIERYLKDLARPGALTAALNWYRANAKLELPTKDRTEFPNIKCPVLGIWSDGDHYLTEKQIRTSHEKITGSWRYEKIKGASHWMMLDKPNELNRLLVEFLTK
jgi:pimeloyl-ACP methyl ester carboxylesterase